MKPLDRLLQRWRVRKASRFLSPGLRVLDVGCGDGVLRDLNPQLGSYVGIDPEATSPGLIRGTFPHDLPAGHAFDAVVLLAVLEHVPDGEVPRFAQALKQALVPAGVVILTVPSPFVDRVVGVMQKLRLIDGMSLEQHHGFRVERVPEIFDAPDFELVEHRRFQLGLNNLFVFRAAKPSIRISSPNSD